MKKNEEGSVLVWAIAVVMVLFISVGAALSISSSYYHRAMQSNDERQAYLTAKGVIEDMVNKIIMNDEAYLALFKDLSVFDKTYLTIPLDSRLGTISTQSSYIECLPVNDTKGRITISITAEVGDVHYNVNADLKKGRIETADKWQLVRYYQGKPTHGLLNNIEIASKTLNEYQIFGNCWLNSQSDQDARSCLVDEMKKDSEGYANVIASNPNYKPWKSNDVIRYYFYYRNNPAGWPVFNKSEITNQTLKEKLKISDYYIQPFTTTPDGSLFFIYAKTYKDNAMAQGWNNVNLFYHDGHWYYVDRVDYSEFINGNTTSTKPGEGVMITSFNTSTTEGPNNSATEKWARFVKAYLTPENILE